MDEGLEIAQNVNKVANTRQFSSKRRDKCFSKWPDSDGLFLSREEGEGER